jgi:tungstate transport system substrate-binding protein
LLKPAFLADCPEYTLKGVFVGSGTAIAYGGSGDADVLLTHSPAAEINFMNGLVGTNPPVPSKYRGKSRYKVMYNHFYLVGTKANPAGISESQSAKSAFQSIATNGSDFWSRNDGSGTNAKEKEIWKSLSPSNPQVGKTWYKATGTLGMAQALANVNNANTGYTLSDSATWLNWLNLQPDLLDAKGKATPDPDTGGYTNIKDVNIKIINQGDATYFNQYSVIEVDGAKNREGAQDFSNWIRSPKAQALIGQYGQVSYGKPLFVPNQGSY